MEKFDEIAVELVEDSVLVLEDKMPFNTSDKASAILDKPLTISDKPLTISNISVKESKEILDKIRNVKKPTLAQGIGY